MNSTHKLTDLLTIGITTKNRYLDLKETLSSLGRSELRNYPIIIIDDGSDTPVINPSDYSLKITFIRYEESKGLIPRRNEIARLCKTKYLMSLDDDSAPISGSIADVLGVFEMYPHVKTVALHILPPSVTPDGKSLSDYETRLFIGCGHIHEVETFKQLGGYSEHLVYGYEEVEYSLKLAAKGYSIMHKSDYFVIHNRSMVNRPGYYNAQCVINRGWVNGTYLGLLENLIEFYSLIRNHGLRSTPKIIPLYMKGIRSVTNRTPLRFLDYIHWKLKKTPSIA